eukprot:scaffold2061_cov192-Skeletonema_marinoi.AAC.3
MLRYYHTNYHGSLQADDCHIHSVRYDTDVNGGTWASQMNSSGHLRRCSDADTYVVLELSCHNTKGKITTLGHGGSDLTATAIGAALEVDEVQ